MPFLEMKDKVRAGEAPSPISRMPARFRLLDFTYAPERAKPAIHPRRRRQPARRDLDAMLHDAAAGAVFKLSAEDIERRVRSAGFVPRRRNVRHELLPLFDGAAPIRHEGIGDHAVVSLAISA